MSTATGVNLEAITRRVPGERGSDKGLPLSEAFCTRGKERQERYLQVAQSRRAKVVNGGLRSGNSSLPFPPTKMEQFDLEFDFEHDLSSEVGQPAEAPQSMPPNARKNYRQVGPPLRHAIIPLISES